MRTKDIYSLRFTNGGEPTQGERDVLTNSYQAWQDAVNGDSSDAEHDAARELIEELLAFASIEIDSEEVQLCDECDEEAAITWPKLNPPVALCDGCHHNATRSGWAPGQ